MTGFGLLVSLWAATAGAPPEGAAPLVVTVTTLSGEERAGVLSALTRETVTLTSESGEKSLPVADLMEVRFPAPATPVSAPPEEPSMVVTLADDSRLKASKFLVGKREVTIETALWGTIKLPLASVSSVRFATPDQQVDKSWVELSERDRKDDMLVIRKGDVLDHLDGAVGDIDDTLLHFVLDNEEVPVKREKIFGVLYASRKAAARQPVCEAVAAGGDRLKLRQVSWDGAEWKATLSAGGEVTVPADRLSALDFSLGKVKSLSDLEWRDMKLTTYWDTESDRILFAPQKDHNGDGGRLRLGIPLRPNSRFLVSKAFTRGLWIHSRTQINYRLGGDYRRFQATMGISYEMLRLNRGDVHVTISGDGKTLFDADVSWNEPAQPLDLDVSNVRDLEILVDFGKDQLPEGDELILGDARLVK